MSQDERDYLQSLPSQITIYRGMTEIEYKSGNYGISWTLKKELAKFFADIYVRNNATCGLKKTIRELVIDKKDVIAFFDGRQEYEIIYTPQYKSRTKQTVFHSILDPPANTIILPYIYYVS